jgi:hypothetical protein
MSSYPHLPPLVRPQVQHTSLVLRFEAFHRANPHVYDAVLDIAFDLQRLGFKHGSINLIFERLRWIYAIQTVGDPFRLNNNFRAYYARTIMADQPSLQGFFRLRRVRGAKPYVPDLIALGIRLPVAPSVPSIILPPPPVP